MSGCDNGKMSEGRDIEGGPADDVSCVASSGWKLGVKLHVPLYSAPDGQTRAKVEKGESVETKESD